MRPRSARPHLVALAALGIATTAPATGAETPDDVVLAIPYGFERGMLDTSRVDRDDPNRTLISAYQVGEDVVYVRALQGILTDSLLCYRGGAFVGTLPMKGTSDFLVLRDGTVYGVTLGSGANVYARLYRRQPDGTTEMVKLLRATLDSRARVAAASFGWPM